MNIFRHLQEVVVSPYYRVRPFEVLRLAYAKWALSRHRVDRPAKFLREALEIESTDGLAGFDRWRPKLERVVASAWGATGQQGGVSLEDGIILYSVTRQLMPGYVIETGIAAGVSTSFIGAALVDNGRGILYSIELPPQESASRDHLDGAIFDWPKKGVGWAIPGEIKAALGARHVIMLGDVRDVLPQLLSQLPAVDLFFHDDLHTPDHMLWEYQSVWPHMRRGGVLISDDANFGWIQFCRKHGRDGRALINIQRLTAIRK